MKFVQNFGTRIHGILTLTHCRPVFLLSEQKEATHMLVFGHCLPQQFEEDTEIHGDYIVSEMCRILGQQGRLLSN